jgi:hypothetical protein
VCGTTYRVDRQRWVDRDAQPELHARILIDGPLSGSCPICEAPALGRLSWLEVAPSEERATLVLGAHQRAEVVDALQSHLRTVAAREATTPGWLLQPAWRFERSATHASVSEAPPPSPPAGYKAKASPARGPGGPPAKPLKARPSAARRPGVPTAVGQRGSDVRTAPSQDAYVCELEAPGGEPTVEIVLDEAGRQMWGRAALSVRPIHLRDFNYPLVGVRLSASYLGQTAVIDAIVDVAEEAANEVFARLSASLSVRLNLRSEHGSTPVSRDVSADDLGRNAALCLESARGVLATEEFPAEAFERATTALSDLSAEQRQRAAVHPLARGDFLHLLTPRESWAALEALEAASDKPNLAHLLERDGLPVGEFEAIRKRVLAGALEHGLCVPRRFWRRIIASGLCEDAADYAHRLAARRAAWEESDDDLDEQQQQRAWENIRELCKRRDLAFPEELMAALGIEEPPRRPARAGNASSSAAGEIQVSVERTPTPRPKKRVSLDPMIELRGEVGGLGNKGDSVPLPEVISAIETANDAELLSLSLPLHEAGSQAIPALIGLLSAGRPEIRQMAAILLGLSPDGTAIRPLVARLYAEDTKAWRDVARALGRMGPRALGSISGHLRVQPAPRPGDQNVLRASMAMAQICFSDGGSSMAQDAVEALADASDTGVARAAKRAVATLHEVKVANDQVMGSRAMPDVTQVRAFSRRVYDALGLAGPLAKKNEETQVLDLGELMEFKDDTGGLGVVQELDASDVESV